MVPRERWVARRPVRESLRRGLRRRSRRAELPAPVAARLTATQCPSSSRRCSSRRAGAPDGVSSRLSGRGQAVHQHDVAPRDDPAPAAVQALAVRTVAGVDWRSLVEQIDRHAGGFSATIAPGHKRRGVNDRAARRCLAHLRGGFPLRAGRAGIHPSH